MDFKRRIENVKDLTDMPSAAERYSGQRINAGGFICCPFHNEKTPSMKIYRKSFYCFGCGCGGDVLDFTKKIFNCSFTEALQTLEKDLGISVPDEKNESKIRGKGWRMLVDQRKIRKHSDEMCKRRYENFKTQFSELFYDFYKLCSYGSQDPKNGHFEFACLWLSEAEYLLACLENNFEEFYRDIQPSLEKIEDKVYILKVKAGEEI